MKKMQLDAYIIHHNVGVFSKKTYNYYCYKSIFIDGKMITNGWRKHKFYIYRFENHYYIVRNNVNFYFKIPIFGNEKDKQVIEMVQNNFKKIKRGKYIKHKTGYSQR